MNYPLIAKLASNLFGRTSLVEGGSFSGLDTLDEYYEKSMFKKVEFEGEYPQSIIDETFAKFHSANLTCRMVNENFDRYFSNPELASLLFTWRRCVHSFLEGISPDVSEIAQTNGATSSSRKGALPTERVSKAEVTSRLSESPLFRFSPWKTVLSDFRYSFIPSQDGVKICRPELVYHSNCYPVKDYIEGRLVPKTFLSARLVWPEPAINASHQRGTGKQMSRAINRTHLHTGSAKEKHQRLARLGSAFDGVIATSDWTSASDLIAWRLSQFLAPARWGVAMDLFRSATLRYPVNGVTEDHTAHVTATMGNGFCWEWETIVFYCFIRAIAIEHFPYVDPRDLHAFGDDTIYPVEMHDHVVRYSKVFGWKMNEEKSFSDGGFRESCGGDYFNSLPVRPVFCKSLLDTTVQKYRLHNEIVCAFGSMPKSAYYRMVLQEIVADIPVTQRFYGPREYGDRVLFSTDPSLYTLKEGKGKFSRPMIKVLDQHFEDTHSIGDKPVTVGAFRRALYLGFLNGHGLVWSSSIVRQKGTIVLDDTGKPVREQLLRHPMVVKNGTHVTYKPKWVAYYAYPNHVDEENPLTVFEVLSGASRNITTRDYLGNKSRRLLAIKKLEEEQKRIKDEREKEISESLSSSFDDLLGQLA